MNRSQPSPVTFDKKDVEIIARETLYRGFFSLNLYRFRHRLFNGEMSPEITREIFERGHAAVLLPYDPVRDEVVLIEQLRIAAVDTRSSGLAAAHAIHNGFTVLEECHHLYHGEKVAFGTLAQLVLQNSPMAQIETVLAFCHDIGLPITLAQMGVTGDATAKMMAVAEASCAAGETIHNMPFKVTPAGVQAAILTADRLGAAWLQRH